MLGSISHGCVIGKNVVYRVPVKSTKPAARILLQTNVHVTADCWAIVYISIRTYHSVQKWWLPTLFVGDFCLKLTPIIHSYNTHSYNTHTYTHYIQYRYWFSLLCIPTLHAGTIWIEVCCSGTIHIVVCELWFSNICSKEINFFSVLLYYRCVASGVSSMCGIHNMCHNISIT